MTLTAARVLTVGSGAGALALLGGLGYRSEQRYLDHATDVRVATPYDLGKVALEAGAATTGLLFGVVLKGPLHGQLRSVAAVMGCMGAAGLAYRGAAMLARYEHATRNPGRVG